MASIRKIWTFDDPGSYGARMIVAGLVRGLQSAGCEVFVTPLRRETPQATIELRQGLEEADPDALFFVNQPSAVYLGDMGYSPGEVASLDIPRLIWILDDPFIMGKEPFGEHDIVVAADPAFLPNIKERGARHAVYLPVAADSLELGQYRNAFASPVAYVGSVKDMSDWRAQLAPDLAAYFDSIVERRLLDPHRTFPELLEDNLLQETKRVTYTGSLAYYLYVLTNNLWRICMLEPLVPLGLKIYGNAEWGKILPEDSALRGVLHPPIDPAHDLPDLAVSATVNINLRSQQGFASPTQRDFIFPGFGGFLLSSKRHAAKDVQESVKDWWDGLESPVAASPQALYDAVAYWLDHPSKRREWIESRRETIKRKHTYHHRAVDLLKILETAASS